jgi:excisionase family DNA binding protein
MSTDELAGAFTVSEFCEVYNVGRTFLYQEIKSGRLSAVKAGTKTLVMKAEAARWARCLPALKTSKASSN